MSHKKIPKRLHKINYNYSDFYLYTVLSSAKKRRQKLENNRKKIEARMPRNYFSNENTQY